MVVPFWVPSAGKLPFLDHNAPHITATHTATTTLPCQRKEPSPRYRQPGLEELPTLGNIPNRPDGFGAVNNPGDTGPDNNTFVRSESGKGLRTT